jgi:choline kinase
MIGLVLAAGAGRRLRPYTDTLPKALVPVGPEGDEDSLTVLDLTLGNFAEIGLTEVAIIVGYRKEAVYERREALEQKYGVKITLIDNDKAEEWNNAYSLWCGRDAIKHSVILANGDTVHPVSVEKTLLAARGDGKKIILALDTVKSLADEEMKVVVGPEGGMTKITKLMDPQQFYEHGYQELVNRGFRIDVAPIGDVKWVEIDNHDDLAKGREIACQY